MTVKACIFDFDGTLADSMWVWTDIGQNFCLERDIEPDESFSEQLAMLGFDAGARLFVDRYGLNEEPQAIVAGWLDAAERAYASSVHLKPGAKNFIQQIRDKGVCCAVATAQQRRPLELALINEDALELFDVALPCDEVTDTGKATPAVYLAAAKLLSVGVDDCLVFEDVVGPALQAKSAGFKVVGVYDESPAQDHDELRRVTDFFIEDYLQTESLLSMIG